MEQSNKIFILLASCYLLTCCVEINKQDHDFNKLKTEISNYYSIKNTFDHFPNDITDNSIKQTYIVWPSQECLSEVYVLQKSDAKTISKIIDNQCIKQSSVFFDSTNFIMTLDWLWDTTNIHHLHSEDQLSSIPIPDFAAVNFGTKEISYSENIDGENVTFTKQEIPEDFIVFVIEAQSGNFWKNKTDSIRPNSLGNWKHGYSRGFAVSESMSIICYWLIMW